MDLLTTLLTCSLYLGDDALVRAIAQGNSQSNPYFVLDASADPTAVDPPPPPKSAAEAAARAKDLLAKGGRPLLGLMQLPPAWLEAFGRPLEGAFDPCTNVAVGTAMLSEFDAECAAQERPAHRAQAAHAAPPRAHGPSLARRRCVVRLYQAALGLPDFATLLSLELRYQRPARPAVEDAPILAPEEARPWGPSQLLCTPTLPMTPQ